MVQQIISDTQVIQKTWYQEHDHEHHKQNSKWAELLEFKGNQVSGKNIINYHHSFLPEDVRCWKQNSTSFFTQLLSQYRLVQSKKPKQNRTPKPKPNQALNPRLKIKMRRNLKSSCHTSEVIGFPVFALVIFPVAVIFSKLLPILHQKSALLQFYPKFLVGNFSNCR